jgi:putative PIN family toxin of toxin-antitoxin system
MRAVVDTNVFVSALLVDVGTPAAVLRSWRRGEFDVVTSPELMAELRTVLDRPARSTRLRNSPLELLLRLEVAAFEVHPGERIEVIADDPSDNRLLEAGVAGDADFIVSGDGHLLSLGSYGGVAIVTPARFAAILAEQRSR